MQNNFKYKGDGGRQKVVKEYPFEKFHGKLDAEYELVYESK